MEGGKSGEMVGVVTLTKKVVSFLKEKNRVTPSVPHRVTPTLVTPLTNSCQYLMHVIAKEASYVIMMI